MGLCSTVIPIILEFTIDGLVISPLLSGNDLSGEIFQSATEKLAKVLSVDPSRQRLDSIHRGGP